MTFQPLSALRNILVGTLLASSLGNAQERSGWRYDFSGSAVRSGWTVVAAEELYSPEKGYGFERGSQPKQGRGCVVATQPYVFSVRLAEGNYRVQATLGSDDGSSTNTVKAELRRLMLERITTKSEGSLLCSFVVNIRTPKISDGEPVRLKPREKETESVNWDEKLTLEFNGSRPCLRSLEITPADVPTVFLLGDSTVCDQPREPWNSWGQMLPRFFKPDIAIANHAESGESLKSSLGARRFEKVFSLMKSGDWLFLQYGHNDMKDRVTNALGTYKMNLRRIVARTRERGGIPVLVTSMERKSGVDRDTLDGYPETMRAVAEEESVALIDLHRLSQIFYRALGRDLDKAFQDGTHHNNYGSYELARCVVQAVRTNNQLSKLAKYFREDASLFSPSQPDPPDQFHMPPSPAVDFRKPEGN